MEAADPNAILACAPGLGKAGPITPEYLEADIGPLLKPGDIVVVRNNDAGADDVPAEDRPCFTPQSATWLRERRIKMLCIDNNVALSDTIERGRQVHDILMSRDVVLVEWLDNLADLRAKEFFFMALPYKVRVMDSSWARVIAIEERS